MTFVRFLTALYLITSAACQQLFSQGISIIDAPSAGSPGHAGSNLPIAVEISGNGQLTEDAANPSSSSATHIFSLEIFLVSSETDTNLTVSSGTGFLTNEKGTVRHLDWPIPTCVPPGRYNLTFYEYSVIDGEPHFIITPVGIPVENANPSGECTEADGLNELKEQPQESSPPPFGGRDDVILTITLDGSVPLELPTRTVTETGPLSTVVFVSMQTLTTGQGTATSTITQTSISTAVMSEDELSGFLPASDPDAAGPRIVQQSSAGLICLLMVGMSSMFLVFI